MNEKVAPISLVAALLIFAFSAFSSAADTKITIGYAAVSPRTLPLIIAQEQGLFAKQGIEARLVLSKARRFWWPVSCPETSKSDIRADRR